MVLKYVAYLNLSRRILNLQIFHLNSRVILALLSQHYLCSLNKKKIIAIGELILRLTKKQYKPSISKYL